MDISIWTTEENIIPINKRIPSSNILGEDIRQEGYTLVKGDSSCEGKEVIITGKYYQVNKRKYFLGDFGLRAKITDEGLIVPILRKARGSERIVFQKVIRNSHCLAERQGDLNDYWPEIVKLPISQTTISLSAINSADEALQIAEEIISSGQEIDEDFSFDWQDDLFSEE